MPPNSMWMYFKNTSWLLVSFVPIFLYFLYELCSKLAPSEQSWIIPLCIHAFGIFLFYLLSSSSQKKSIFRFNTRGLLPTLFLCGLIILSPIVLGLIETLLFQELKAREISVLNYTTSGSQILYFAILIPAIEEIFFRGCLSFLFSQYFGDLFGRIYSILCFTALHDSSFFALGPFILAILCEYLLKKYENLTNCIILHGCANFSAIWFATSAPRIFEWLKSIQIFV